MNIMKKGTCGYPGSPRNGRVLHLLERYEEGMIVTYECDDNYFLLGPITRTCLSNNTWSGYLPICDQSIRNLGLTSASEALTNYPSQLAVDGNFRTCFFSNRRKPRWWRVELPKQLMNNNQSIISIALTLPPINVELYFSIYVIEIETKTINNETNETNSSMNDKQDLDSTSTTQSLKYHKCATFRGVFSSKTIFVQCSSSLNSNGLRGSYLQIEDDYPQLEYFGLCEVDVFIKRQYYDCGQVEIPAFGFVIDQQISIDGIRSVEYHCHAGYRLIGQSIRKCNRQTGQWFGNEPYCERITCPEPKSITNGFHRLYGEDYYDKPVVGSRAVYECRPGYVFVDTNINDTKICNENGQWSDDRELPECEPIDCGHPESLLINSDEFFLSGSKFRLLNGTTKFSSIAELICSTNELTRTNLLFRCREDGLWTEIINFNDTTIQPSTTSIKHQANSCVRQRHNGFLYFYTPSSSSSLSTMKNFFRNKNFYIRETSVNIMHLLAAVVIAAFLSILIIIILMFKRNIIEWPETINQSSTIKCRIKTTGESIIKFLLSIFYWIKNFFIRSSSSSSNIDPENNDTDNDTNNDTDEEKEQSRRSSTKTLSIFTITPSLSLDNDSSQNVIINQQQQQQNDNNSTSTSSSNQINTINDTKKNKDFNQALATFYEEITNAAKQMFSEETDRKLIRAARIAAELDAIKYQQQQHQQKLLQQQQQQQYQWIYSTPPRIINNNGHPSGCTSLPPSLHEYHQILPSINLLNNNQQQQHLPVTQNQIYAKIDLIRKHRYRKEKDNNHHHHNDNVVSVYQVPKPRCPIQSSSSNQQQQQQQHYYQLRKAISTPDYTLFNQFNNNFNDNDCGGEYEYGYGTIYRMKNKICTSNTMQKPKTTTTTTTVTIHEPINKFPLKTLL